MKTDPFLRTKNRIRQDADGVFDALMKHVREQYLASDRQRELAQVKMRIVNHFATVLRQKEMLLHDTLLNHLTKDAIEALADADTLTKNRFHASNRAWIERAKAGDSMVAPSRMRFSPDRRLAYSAGAGLLVGGGVRWLVAGSAGAALHVPLVLGSIAAAALLTFQAASHQSFRSIESEAEIYLNAYKAGTLEAFDTIIDDYRAGFSAFVGDAGPASHL